MLTFLQRFTIAASERHLWIQNELTKRLQGWIGWIAQKYDDELNFVSDEDLKPNASEKPVQWSQFPQARHQSLSWRQEMKQMLLHNKISK